MTRLINFIDLTLEEKKMVLKWRNHPFIKKWMYGSEDISLKNHLEFIDSLKHNKNKLYFLVEYENDYIGVIDFSNIKDTECDFGLYANVNQKGVGKKLLELICHYAFKELHITTLKAEVFTYNKRAISLYKKFNFREIEKREVKNKEIVYMELKNENR